MKEGLDEPSSGESVNRNVHLGFEVGSGRPVAIPLRHMVVTGQTQSAGKTTTLEALISRANLPAVAFVTKRGERSFVHGRRIAPYFRERSDWQFVASVLEATMRERLKFERAWIMRAAKGARTLADVHKNVRRLMEKATGLSADVYLTLDAYLEIVVPRVAAVRFADRLELAPGLNVVDLSDRDRFPPELQSLVMRSVLEWVYEKADGTITIIPEAWEYIPQSRGSPVKLAAIELIRKGAGLSNFVWCDSQDIGGVDKELLRSCHVWLLGVQREANEIKRVLASIPAGIAKPTASDVAGLRKGQFYACFGDAVVKTYVQPVWMEAGEAARIARGELAVEDVAARAADATPVEEPMSTDTEKKLDTIITLLTRQAETASGAAPTPAAFDEEALYQRFKARLVREAPSLLRVIATAPEIEIKEAREVVEIDGRSVRGGIAKLIARGFFDEPRTGNTVFNELKRVGVSVAKPNAYRECDKLTTMGFLTKEEGGYRVVQDMKANIRQ